MKKIILTFAGVCTLAFGAALFAFNQKPQSPELLYANLEAMAQTEAKKECNFKCTGIAGFCSKKCDKCGASVRALGSGWESTSSCE